MNPAIEVAFDDEVNPDEVKFDIIKPTGERMKYKVSWADFQKFVKDGATPLRAIAGKKYGELLGVLKNSVIEIGKLRKKKGLDN